MKLRHRETGESHEAIIDLLLEEDWKVIEKSDSFSFNWKQEKKRTVNKIRLKNESEIQGLVSYEDIPKEFRIHLHLIENSQQNKGKLKKYDFIAGCLIARTCEIAFEKNYNGFVSLEPKTELVFLYKNKYGFEEMGNYLFTELSNSERLIKEYLTYEK